MTATALTDLTADELRAMGRDRWPYSVGVLRAAIHCYLDGTATREQLAETVAVVDEGTRIADALRGVTG